LSYGGRPRRDYSALRRPFARFRRRSGPAPYSWPTCASGRPCSRPAKECRPRR